MHVERTFSVPAAVEQVFDYLSDFTRTNEWDPGTVRTTRTSGDGGVGTTYANTSRFMGREVDLTYETLTFDRPRRVVFRGRNKLSTATDDMTFSHGTDEASTTIRYRADFAFAFPLNVLAPLFIRSRLEKLADETVAQIQRVLTTPT